jgi:hypothetical protein
VSTATRPRKSPRRKPRHSGSASIRGTVEKAAFVSKAFLVAKHLGRPYGRKPSFRFWSAQRRTAIGRIGRSNCAASMAPKRRRRAYPLSGGARRNASQRITDALALALIGTAAVIAALTFRDCHPPICVTLSHGRESAGAIIGRGSVTGPAPGRPGGHRWARSEVMQSTNTIGSVSTLTGSGLGAR